MRPLRARALPALLLLLVLCCGTALGGEPERVDYGRWSGAHLARLIAGAQQIAAPGERIAAISRPFLDTPYVADTLIGGPHTAEQLVIDLAGVDCFTLLDQVEALRRAASVADLPEQLRQVRYRGGEVRYENRRHFFSDWVAEAASPISDVTAAVGRGRAERTVKQLNRKDDGTLWLAGIPVTRREIAYLPADRVDGELLSALRTGDYVGIYTTKAGLDVSHVGLVVREGDRVRLRHASSRSDLRRVVDVDLLDYLQGKPGLVVYRVRE